MIDLSLLTPLDRLAAHFLSMESTTATDRAITPKRTDSEW
jgi:hypothetical protein